MEKEKTICAISTPIGNGGISVVRMSGAKSKQILQKITTLDTKKMTARKMYLAKIKTANFEEQALVVWFEEPLSYTGEEMVEIQCHGGIVIANGILSELLKNGAKLAESGEFTKRAFINGKMSLDSAEGVIDMINAQSEEAVKAGYGVHLRRTGNLYRGLLPGGCLGAEVRREERGRGRCGHRRHAYDDGGGRFRPGKHVGRLF